MVVRGVMAEIYSFLLSRLEFMLDYEADNEFKFSVPNSNFLRVASNASLFLIGVGGLSFDADRVTRSEFISGPSSCFLESVSKVYP